MTRRSTERELGEGSKKRATSASGLDRQSEGKRQKNKTFSYHVVSELCIVFMQQMQKWWFDEQKIYSILIGANIYFSDCD
jgi:hypothetical protein